MATKHTHAPVPSNHGPATASDGPHTASAAPPPAATTVEPTKATAPSGNPEDNATKRRAPEGLKETPAAILAILEAFTRKSATHQAAGDVVGLVATLKETALELEALLKDGHGPAPTVPTESTEEIITIPGEGAFAVFVNSTHKVELVATMHLAGSGIMSGDSFGVDPHEAIRLVLQGGAVAKHPGGVRRVKGQPAGEQAASA